MFTWLDMVWCILMVLMFISGVLLGFKTGIHWHSIKHKVVDFLKI